MHKKLLVALSAVGILTLAGCGGSQPSYPDLNPPLSGDYVADFSQGESEEVFASDGWSNGQPFNAVWKKENISYADGKMKLTIKDEDVTVVEEEKEVTYPYSAAEARTHKLYGYGDFQVRMKPSKAYGSVTTFFTYTDEWNKTGGVANKHDEIDIEFLGKDTTKVQFHYYVGGVSYPEYMYDLGFDASLEFHTYGFRWEEDCISWTVDGKTAYQVKGNTTNLPSMPGRIMASYWPSSAAKWSGLYTETSDTSCEYEWIKSNAPTSYADGEEPVPAFDEDVNWDEIDAIDTEFVNAWDNDYTIVKDAEDPTKTTVTYDRIGGWKQLKSSDAVRYAKHADTLKITLKNNSTTRDVNARVDVQGDHSTSTGEVSSKDSLNIQAYSTETTVTTDLDWGGSKFVIPANEEVTVHVNYDKTSETMGEPKSLLFFLDSMQDGYIDVPGSSVTIKDIKFANLDGTPVTPDPKPEPPAPTGDVDWDKVDATPLTYWASSSDIYTFENNGTNAVTVNYTDATGYACIGSASANAVADANNTVKVTLRNNSDHAAAIRMDVQVTGGASTISAVKAEGYDEAYISDGSAFITVAVNESVDLFALYDASLGTANIMFFIDSMGEATSGSVIISDVKFAKVAEPAPGGDVDWDKVDANALTYWASGIYTFENNNTTAVTVNYTDATGYACIGSASANTVIDANNTVKVTLRNNNGEHAANIRMDVQVTGGASAIQAAYATGHDEVHVTDGSAFIVVGVNETVDLFALYDASLGATNLMFFIDSMGEATSGSVTISDVKFANIETPASESIELTFGTQNTYTLDPKDVATSSVNVTYTNMAGNCYFNFGAGLNNVTDKTTFAVTMKNNGESPVKARVDVKGTTEVGHTNTINTSAYATGHSEIYTDTEWGGSTIEIAAGEEVEFIITFDQTTDRGAATYVMFFLDSFMGSETTHSGNVTLSNFVLA